MSEMMFINVGLAALNGFLALVLAIVFWRNHAEIRSPFTMALGFFALFFVFHNALLLYHFFAMMTTFDAATEWFLLGEGLFQTTALSWLAYATFR